MPFGYRDNVYDNINAIQGLQDSYSQGVLGLAALRNRQQQFLMQQAIERQYLELARAKELRDRTVSDATIAELQARTKGYTQANDVTQEQRTRATNLGQAMYNLQIPPDFIGPQTQQSLALANERRYLGEETAYGNSAAQRQLQSFDPTTGYRGEMFVPATGQMLRPPEATPVATRLTPTQQFLERSMPGISARIHSANQPAGDPAELAQYIDMINQMGRYFGMTNQLTAPQQQPQVPPTNNIPPAAIQHLINNPQLSDAFDAKYGPGSSTNYLRRQLSY